jgi:DNA-binding NarL/FixJ family response regulator
VLILAKPFWSTSIHIRIAQHKQTIRKSAVKRKQAVQDLVKNGFSRKQIATLSLA